MLYINDSFFVVFVLAKKLKYFERTWHLVCINKYYAHKMSLTQFTETKPGTYWQDKHTVLNFGKFGVD